MSADIAETGGRAAERLKPRISLRAASRLALSALAVAAVVYGYGKFANASKEAPIAGKPGRGGRPAS